MTVTENHMDVHFMAAEPAVNMDGEPIAWGDDGVWHAVWLAMQINVSENPAMDTKSNATTKEFGASVIYDPEFDLIL